MSRTVLDWLAHARASVDAAEARRCLDAAAALARETHHWRAILAALADVPAIAPDRVAELAASTLECAEAAGDVWGFRDVADIRADRLADPGGARHALSMGLESLRRRDPPGYVWSILAAGFVATLDDAAAARRCLDEGSESARRRRCASDLADLATALDKLGDRQGALALAAEAERMVDLGDAVEARSVAGALHELAEFSATTRLLTAATDRAQTTQDAVFLAGAFDSHLDESGIERAMDRATELAASADDWVTVAKASRDTRRGDTAVRAALDRAAALIAGDSERGRSELANPAASASAERERVAAGYLQLLGDSAAADRVGPRGARPETRGESKRPMPGWDASPAPLFDWLRARISRDALAEIAAADYGNDVDEHLAALLDIQASGLVPQRFAWHPGEVLALARWQRGERVDHLGRAWCCTLLFFDGDEAMEHLPNLVPGLVESCLALGDPAPEYAGQLLAWLCETESDPFQEGDCPPVEALFGLLLLCAGRDPADPRVDMLVSMLMSVEPDYVHRLYGGSVIVDVWDELTGRILAPLRGGRPELDGLLGAIGWPLDGPSGAPPGG